MGARARRVDRSSVVEVTAKTITDEQIKELWERHHNAISGRTLCIAAGVAVGGRPSSIEEIHAARSECAEAWNARHGGEPTCSTCNDTHRMGLGDREVMCTHCPLPCKSCGGRPIGPFCVTTPCPCACHGGSP